MSDAPGTVSQPDRGRRYLPAAVIFLLGILAASGLFRATALKSPGGEEAQNDTARVVRLQESVGRQFDEYSREFVGTCTRLSRSQALLTGIRNSSGKPSPDIFRILDHHQSPGATFEIYTRDRELIGWIGAGGIRLDESVFADSLVDEILQGPIFTYYSVVLPILDRDSIAGYLAGRMIFEVRYPLSNRFISSTLFRSTFTAGLEGGEAIRVLPPGEPDTSALFAGVSLVGVHGRGLATLLIPIPAGDESREETSRILSGIEAIAWFLLILIVAGSAYRMGHIVRSVAVRLLIFSALIWVVRFSMLWLGIPARFTTEGIFDPYYYASTFGYGLAQSAGEALISSLFLFLTMLRVAGVYLHREADSPGRGRHGKIPARLTSIAGTLLAGTVLWTLMRGVSAMIRSAVVDTTLSYTDPSMLFPPPALCALLFSAFLVASSFVIAAVLMFLASRRSIAGSFGVIPNGWVVATLVVLIYSVTGILYGILHPNPLTALPERIAITFLISTAIFVTSFSSGHGRPALGSVWLLVTIAAIMVVVRFDSELREFDRSRVELVAEEISRPVDSWLSFVVNRALDEMSTPATVDALFNGSQEDIEKLAFTSWARSILSREGLNCSVLVVDYDGRTVSDFRVGAGSSPAESQLESSSLERSVTVEERDGDGGRNIWYVGFVPLYSASGTPMGGVRIEVSATKKVFLRGEAPEILRNYGRDDRRTRERPVIFSEFSGSQMLSTTSESIPLAKAMPAEANDSSRRGGLWLEESIGGVEFESYYFKPMGSYPSSTAFALSLRTHDMQWRAFVALRIIALYGVLALAGFLAVAVMRLRRGRPVRMSFRAKILLTFVFVSVIPLAVMTLYNREYAVERAEQQMVRMLSDETDRVVGILQSDYAIQTPFDLARLRDADCTEIAEKASTDFNLYGTRELLASSRPEVFVSELIDRRLSGAAFRSIALDRLSFYSERQSIGTLEYVVGYRPLLSSAGEVIGVVSVHTLYRQQEVDNEAVSRNSYLFGAYAMSCLIAVGLGLVFSRRISSPIRRLQVATRRIAAGDLNISLRSHRTDELGELEQAFDTMASDLKAHQERIIRTERELAWREMAKQVAHEIKNPLTPMQLSVQHLRRAYEDGARDFGSILAHVSQVLLDQIETLSRIATEFSRFARMPDRRPVPCDVHQLLADASDLFAQHPGVTLTTSLAAEQMTVLADVEELRRAFVNILRNAVQAMAEHGSITIETEQSGERIVIGITDSGPGISDSVKENLFKPNFSTKTEGMGLGLAIVKKTIDDLQGDIRIESEPGKGTTVRITLPVLMPPVR